MTHSTDSLEYMSRLRDQQVFRFCAIPQVMAIATLAECYDNPNVFRAVVKIPRSMRCAGASARLCAPC
jgi:farnesyl-diphosphate farnesyltransferase